MGPLRRQLCLRKKKQIGRVVRSNSLPGLSARAASMSFLNQYGYVSASSSSSQPSSSSSSRGAHPTAGGGLPGRLAGNFEARPGVPVGRGLYHGGAGAAAGSSYFGQPRQPPPGSAPWHANVGPTPSSNSASRGTLPHRPLNQYHNTGLHNNVRTLPQKAAIDGSSLFKERHVDKQLFRSPPVPAAAPTTTVGIPLPFIPSLVDTAGRCGGARATALPTAAAEEAPSETTSVFDIILKRKKRVEHSVAVVDLDAELPFDNYESVDMDITIIETEDNSNVTETEKSPENAGSRRSASRKRSRSGAVPAASAPSASATAATPTSPHDATRDSTVVEQDGSMRMTESMLDDVICISDTEEANTLLDATPTFVHTPLRNAARAHTLNRSGDNEAEIVVLDDSEDDDENDVIIMEDLTLLDCVDETPFKSPAAKKFSRRTRSRSRRRRSSAASSVCGRVAPKTAAPLLRALEDSLSTGTIQMFQKSPRFWETVQDISVQNGQLFQEIRVCSYNVLCQNTIDLTMYLYKHLSEDCTPLDWERRWMKLENDLMKIDADVFGLQEVQYDHYDSHFKPLMEKLGYGGLYKKRTGGTSMRTDGCAIFYKKDKFELINYRIVEYYVAAKTTMDREQVGQIVRLECRKTRQQLVVANTHLIFNLNRGDIKIGQAAMLIANIHEEMVERGECPLIMTGDFNMEPYSYVYKYITESKLFMKGLPRNELSGQGGKGGPLVEASLILPHQCHVGQDGRFISSVRDGSDGVLLGPDDMSHPLTLTSAYTHFNHNNKRDVSTYHREAANPDFIFYSVKANVSSSSSTVDVFETPSLRLLRRMTLPDFDLLSSTLGPWPNHHVPSDHIALVVDFALVKQ